MEKPVIWLGSSLDDLRAFPADARRIAGYQLPAEGSETMRKGGPKLRRSSGNVFRDVGFPAHEAEHLLVRSSLMLRLEREIKARGLTQAAAAKQLGVSQPRVSNLLRGRIELFSTDMLIDMLARLRVRVRIVARPPARSRVA